MSARENFADNLRRLCLTKGSISAAARALGIHRAQLEKYLNCTREPSADTRKHIASYFGVDEAALYQSPDLLTFDLPQPSKVQIMTEIRGAIRPLLDEPIASIMPGLYHLYFSVPGSTDQVLCSVVIVGRNGSATTFRRLTGWGVKRGTYWARFNGDHKGIVVERLNCLSFVAANQRGLREPTLIRMKWLPVADPVLGGHALVSTHAGPSFSAVVMHPLPATVNLRQAVRASQPRQIDDKAIPLLVREFIPQMRGELVEWVRRDMQL